MVSIDGIFFGAGIGVLYNGSVGIGLRGVNLQKNGVLNGILHDFSHIHGTTVVFVIVQTRRICKMGVGAADFFCFFVHHFGKCGIGARYIFRKRIGTVVCRVEKEAVKTVSDTQFISGNGTDDGGVGFQIVFSGSRGKADLGFQIIDMFEHDNRG